MQLFVGQWQTTSQQLYGQLPVSTSSDPIRAVGFQTPSNQWKFLLTSEQVATVLGSRHLHDDQGPDMDQSTSLEHKRALLLADVKGDVLNILSGEQ